MVQIMLIFNDGTFVLIRVDGIWANHGNERTLYLMRDKYPIMTETDYLSFFLSFYVWVISHGNWMNLTYMCWLIGIWPTPKLRDWLLVWKRKLKLGLHLWTIFSHWKISKDWREVICFKIITLFHYNYQLWCFKFVLYFSPALFNWFCDIPIGWRRVFKSQEHLWQT